MFYHLERSDFIKNKYRVVGDYVYISINDANKGETETIISKTDLPLLLKLNVRWHLWYNRAGLYYVRATEYLGMSDNGKPKYKTWRLHKYIIDCDCEISKYFVIDHINHNTLDNTRENLRVTSSKYNNRHRGGKNSNNTSGYRNVSWSKSENKWVVQLQVNGKNTKLGVFDNVDEAGKFAEEMRKKYYGEYAGKS